MSRRRHLQLYVDTKFDEEFVFEGFEMFQKHYHIDFSYFDNHWQPLVLL